MIRACHFNRPEIVNLLLKHGANLEARTRMGKTALITAVTRNKPTLVDMLLTAGAKIDLRTENGIVADEVAGMSASVTGVINQHKKWTRVKPFLKLHHNRNQSENYPKAFRTLNKNLFRKIVTDYM